MARDGIRDNSPCDIPGYYWPFILFRRIECLCGSYCLDHPEKRFSDIHTIRGSEGRHDRASYASIVYVFYDYKRRN